VTTFAHSVSLRLEQSAPTVWQDLALAGYHPPTLMPCRLGHLDELFLMKP